MSDENPSMQVKPRDEFFSNFYIMMLSVIHGLVLGGAAVGLTSIILPNPGTNAVLLIWGLVRWLTSFLFTVTSAWKYIVGAVYLTWRLDPFDVAIPSLIGIALTGSFIVVDNPTAWVLMTILISVFGVLAGINVPLKRKKSQNEHKEQYGQNLWFNILGGFSIIVVIPILWIFIPDNILAVIATIVAFLFALFQFIFEFKLWKTLYVALD